MISPCWLLTGLFYHYFPVCQVGPGSGRGRVGVGVGSGRKKPRPGWRPGRPVVTERQLGRMSRSRCGHRQLTAGPAPPSTMSTGLVAIAPALGVRIIRHPCVRDNKYRRSKTVGVWFPPIGMANCGGQTSPHKNRKNLNCYAAYSNSSPSIHTVTKPPLQIFATCPSDKGKNSAKSSPLMSWVLSHSVSRFAFVGL